MLEDYKDFGIAFQWHNQSPIASVRNGDIPLYAIDNSLEDENWEELFKKLQDAKKPITKICETPKSHLKSVNEIRPIDTVKRVGYESIPYLASHSEDWLARTATGLKPARLFSRVEDDDFSIYENRVTKTLIDVVITYLRKTEKKLNDAVGQLEGIINSGVQTTGFGFDHRFQMALSELLRSSTESDKSRSEKYKKLKECLKEARKLLRSYLRLQQSFLYRKLKRTKRVFGSLNETNILLMDKNYKYVSQLWKYMQKTLKKNLHQTEVENRETSQQDAERWFMQFCKTLAGYAANNLNFIEQENFLFHKQEALLEYSISDKNGLIHCVLRDSTKRKMPIQNGLKCPIQARTDSGKFSFDGQSLYWKNDITDDDIDRFCNLFLPNLKGKPKEKNQKEQRDAKHIRDELKKALVEANMKYGKLPKSHIIIKPVIVELKTQDAFDFKKELMAQGNKIAEEQDADYVIMALPFCNEAEQQIIEYAHNVNDKVLILPLTIFDINSYRRLQNVLLRQIGQINKEMPGIFSKDDGVHPRLTQCPHCHHKYLYLHCEATEDTRNEMSLVKKEDFYQWDSLFKYKDIVAMTIGKNGFLSVCPNCGKTPSDC